MKKIIINRLKANNAKYKQAGRVVFLVMLFGICGILMYFPLYSDRDPQMVRGIVDGWDYFIPHAHFLDCAIRQGGLPFWNPLTLCGMPYAANPQSLIFYPPNILRALFSGATTPWDAVISMRVVILCHLFLAGLFVVLLARRHGVSMMGSCVSSLAFIFSAGYYLASVSHWVLVATISWYPLILLLMDHSLATTNPREKVRFSLLAGTALGLSLLGGYPQLVFYMGMALLVFVTVRGVVDHCNGEETSSMFSRISFNLFLLTIVCIVAIFIAAAMLLPAAEFAPLSTRNQMTAVQNNLYFLPYYLRCGVLMLAGIAVLRARTSLVWCYGLMALAGIDCFVGRPMPMATLAAAISPWQFVSSMRANLVFSLPLAILAGMGYDLLGKAPSSKRRLVQISLFIGLGICAGTLYACANFRYITLYRSAIILLPILLAGSCVVYECFPTLLPTKPFLVLLVLAELAAWNWTLYERNTAYFMKKTTMTNTLPMLPSNGRMAEEHGNLALYELRPEMTGYDPAQLQNVQKVLCPERLAYNRYVIEEDAVAQNTRGHLFLKRLFWLQRDYVKGALPAPNELFAPTTTVFISPPGEAIPIPERRKTDVIGHAYSDQAARVDLQKDISILRVGNVLNARTSVLQLPAGNNTLCIDVHATVNFEITTEYGNPITGDAHKGLSVRRSAPVGDAVSHVEIPMPDAERLEIKLSLISNDTNTTITDAWLMNDLADEGNLISITSYLANAVHVRVGPLSGWRILTYVDANYPGWRAYIDGKQTPILMANDAFKAVVVPPGEHDVAFEFHSASARLGIGLSGITVCLILAATIGLKINENKRKREHNVT